MAPSALHDRRYRPIPELLRQMRDEAELTQRDLGELLKHPQSWVHNCEVASRRVDVAEFCQWAAACGVDPLDALQRYLDC